MNNNSQDTCGKKLSGDDAIGYYAAGRCQLQFRHSDSHVDQYGEVMRFTLFQRTLLFFVGPPALVGVVVALCLLTI